MSIKLSPLAIRKAEFTQRMRGLDPKEVEDFLELVADEWARILGAHEEGQQELGRLRERLVGSEERERELRETLLRAQKLSDELVHSAQKEAQLLVKEAEMTADRIVTQAMEQAATIEAKIQALRQKRRELHLKFKNTVDLFGEILRADMEEERSTATVHRLATARRPETGEG